METKNRMWKDWLVLYFKGMAMGAADTVPGVSGGTVAFMTNIYEELVYSLQSLNPKAVQTLFSKGVTACWQQVNASFLLVLFAGIVTSLVSLAHAMVFLLTEYTSLVMAFFIGLILASIVFMVRTGERWKPFSFVLFALGALFAAGLGFLPVSDTAPSLLFYFVGGMVAITAMILPGISGSFILVLLGLYLPVMQALKSFNVSVILVFVTGCASGLLLFSQLLAWLFRHKRHGTLVFLTGVLAGSLYNLWPWQLSEPEQALVLVSPTTYADATGGSANTGLCVLLILAGFLLVTGLESLSRKS